MFIIIKNISDSSPHTPSDKKKFLMLWSVVACIQKLSDFTSLIPPPSAMLVLQINILVHHFTGTLIQLESCDLDPILLASNETEEICNQL